MNKPLLSLIAVVALAFSSSAQTNTTVPDPVLSPFTIPDNTNAPALTNFWGPQVNTILEFFSNTSSNWAFAPYVILREEDDEIGAGLAAAYSISDYALAVLRLDYFDGAVYVPSGSVQLQLPITISGRFQLTPFAFTGIATLLNSGGDDGEAIGIVGAGLGLRVSKHIGVVYDIEHWSNGLGLQHRAGILFKF